MCSYLGFIGITIAVHILSYNIQVHTSASATVNLYRVFLTGRVWTSIKPYEIQENFLRNYVKTILIF